jgi:hypothetical protein
MHFEDLFQVVVRQSDIQRRNKLRSRRFPEKITSPEQVQEITLSFSVAGISRATLKRM